MYTGSGIYMISCLDIRPGTDLRVLVVAHPDYPGTEAVEGEPESTLTEEEIRFWQGVLDQQAALLSARRAGTA
jgi:hypothetical protein